MHPISDWTTGMSLRTDILDKTVPAAGSTAAGPAANRPLSAGKAILIWIILMSALWLIIGAGAYILIGTGA